MKVKCVFCHKYVQKGQRRKTSPPSFRRKYLAYTGNEPENGFIHSKCMVKIVFSKAPKFSEAVPSVTNLRKDSDIEEDSKLFIQQSPNANNNNTNKGLVIDLSEDSRGLTAHSNIDPVAIPVIDLRKHSDIEEDSKVFVQKSLNTNNNNNKSENETSGSGLSPHQLDTLRNQMDQHKEIVLNQRRLFAALFARHPELYDSLIYYPETFSGLIDANAEPNV